MLVSQAYGGSSGGNNKCDSATVSSTGRYVAYRSAASNLVPNDTNGVPDIFLYDRLTGATTLISASDAGNSAANGRSLLPVFSGDGQTLFFESWASDLAPGNFNQWLDVFATPLSPAGVGGSTNIPPVQFSGLAVGITNSAVTNGNAVVLTWAAGPGAGYQIQFKNNLTDPQWQNLGGASVIGAQGQLIDLAPNGTQRFYRIVSF